MERGVETALGSAGDFAGAALWRTATRELATGLRVGVLAVDAELAARVVRRLTAAHPDVTVVSVVPLVDDDGPMPGVEDALLGLHALVCATPVTAALGSRDRAALAAVRDAAPAARAVMLADVHLLARVSDDPEAEAELVVQRVRALLDGAWPVLAESALSQTVAEWRRDVAALTRHRRASVAAFLLAEARGRTEASLHEATTGEQKCEDLLDAEDVALDAARRRGQVIAAHLLGSMRGHTEDLLVDLRDFLAELEADLPAQLGPVDVPTIRRVLPHWLDHVVDEWMDKRLAAWRAAVARDIADVRVPADEADRAALLPPALHPAPIRHESGWARRLAVTAALGGGAALALVGLVIPGLVVATSGLALSAFAATDSGEEARANLLDSARTAVRRMADDAERTLGAQLTQIERELEELGDRHAAALEAERAELRGRILEQRAWHRGRREELRQVREALTVRLEALAAEPP